MTAKELANILNGRDYDMQLSDSERRSAKDSGLVIAYGYSDDLFEFDGAIEDEFGAWNGTDVHIKDGHLLKEPNCSEWQQRECEFYKKCMDGYKTITAKWNKCGGPVWTINTEIPHEKFEIIDDGEAFSIGIVFDIKDTYTGGVIK